MYPETTFLLRTPARFHVGYISYSLRPQVSNFVSFRISLNLKKGNGYPVFGEFRFRRVLSHGLGSVPMPGPGLSRRRGRHAVAARPDAQRQLGAPCSGSGPRENKGSQEANVGKFISVWHSHSFVCPILQVQAQTAFMRRNNTATGITFPPLQTPKIGSGAFPLALGLWTRFDPLCALLLQRLEAFTEEELRSCCQARAWV